MRSTMPDQSENVNDIIELQKSAGRVMLVIIDVGACRMEGWKFTILDGVVRCWVGLVESNGRGKSSPCVPSSWTNYPRPGITRYLARDYVQARHRLSWYIPGLSICPPFGRPLRTFVSFLRMPIRLFSWKMKICLVASSTKWWLHRNDCLIFVITRSKSL